MEFRQFTYVLQVAKERSITLAAKKLFISQPSLSQYIMKIERQLGTPLFDRDQTPLQLTLAGELYVETAERILDLNEQLTQKISDITRMKRGRVRIGCSPFRCACLLPRVIPLFKRKFPGIALTLKEDTTKRLEELALRGEVDFSISILPIDAKAFDYEPIFSEEIVLALAPEHPLCKANGLRPGNAAPYPTLRMEQIKDVPIISMHPGQKLRQTLFDLCESAGFTPRILLESQSMDAAQALAGAGLGATLLPATIIHASALEVRPCYFSLDSRPSRTVVVVYAKGRYLSQSARALIEVIKSAYRAEHCAPQTIA